MVSLEVPGPQFMIERLGVADASMQMARVP